MDELTLESLARRVEVLERKLAERSASGKDWRTVVGISEDNEFTRAMLAAIADHQAADRKSAFAVSAP